MIKTKLFSSIAFATLASIAFPAAGSATTFPLSYVGSHNAMIVLAASGDDEEEMDPEDMEAALAKEQARQDAMEDLEKQVSKPLAAFQALYERSIQERETAAHKALDTIFVSAGCNLSAVERLRGEFISSSVLKKGKAEIEAARAKLIETATLYKVSFAATPSDPTDKILQALNEAAPKIKAINADYATACKASEQQMSKVPVTDMAKMTAISSDLQAKQNAMGAQVDQLVGALNTQVDALDAPLVAWALQPLKTAKPK